MLIFLAGKRFSGKDTLGKILVNHGERLGFQVKVDAFANHLKALYCEREHLDYGRFLASRTLKEMHRSYLTAYYKALVTKDKTLFSKNVLEHYLEFVKAHPKPLYIVTDLRFDHDLDPFRELCLSEMSLSESESSTTDSPLSFQTVLVKASDEARRARGWVPSSYDDDPCEKLETLSFDQILENSGTVKDLEDSALILFTTLGFI